TGYDNCDGDWSNGCEVNLLTDSNNCGNCGNVCKDWQDCVNGECNIISGRLSVNIDYPENSLVVDKYSGFVVNGTVECTEGYCGNVNVFLRYNNNSEHCNVDTSYSALPMYTDSNPFNCGEMTENNNNICKPAWTAYGTEKGNYYIDLFADSDSNGVNDVNSEDKSVEIKTGTLSVNIWADKNEITEGDSLVLSASVGCNGGYCGSITLTAKNNGVRIGKTGNIITESENPLSPDACQSMRSGDECLVSWSLTGNSASENEITVAVVSDDSEVWSVVSSSVKVTVNKKIGNLSVTETIEPETINVSGRATVSGKVECSEEYCGDVWVYLEKDTGELVGNENPDIFTNNANPVHCESFPCDVSWDVTANKNGTYILSIVAVSDENINNGTSSSWLRVIKPQMVLEPQISLIVEDFNKEFERDEGAEIKAKLKCFDGVCGNTKIYLQTNESQTWANLSKQTPVATENTNPVSFYLDENEEKEFAWHVEFRETGTYIIRLFAETEGDGKDEFAKTVQVNEKEFEAVLLSPKEGAVFKKGDEIKLKINITKNNAPLENANVFVKSSLFGFVLESLGDGIYFGKTTIPLTAKEGEYNVVFEIDGKTIKTTNIEVKSELNVTAVLDKSEYKKGEEIKIKGTVLKDGKNSPATLKVLLSSGSWKYSETLKTKTGDFEYRYKILFGDPDGVWNISITAEDGYGNKGKVNMQTEIISVPTQLLLMFVSPEPYNVTSYTRCQNIEIKTKVVENNVFVSGAKVECKTSSGDIIELEENDGFYSKNYKIPEKTKTGLLSISCDAVKGEKKGGNYININVKPMKLTLYIVNPISVGDTISLKQGESTEFTIKLTYPDGKPVINATANLSIGNKTVVLKPADLPGFYKINFIPTGSGASIMVLNALDADGNRIEKKIDLIVGQGEFRWEWLFIAGLGVVILIIGWYMYKNEKKQPIVQVQEKIIRLPVKERIREIVYKPVPKPETDIDPVTRMEQKLEALETKLENLYKAKELAEQQYYRRTIDEKTFNKLMQDYEEKIIETEAEIKEIKKELDME
ncbi:MAG: hypothetical protein DRP16_04590, partial [Candidatus Aenigmatarchaeota archaeon]